jgi:outer membrane receptor protein involved in Fe transport
VGRNLTKWVGYITTLILLNIHWSYAQEQTGSIKGTVKTSDGKPASLVNIILSGAGKGAVVDEQGEFYIPSYKVLNASISYEKPAYRISLKMDNVTNEVYWGSYVSQMMPRRFSTTVAFKF